MLLAVLLALVVLAAVEIFVIVTIAHLIGGLLTAALLIVSTVGGLWLVRRERRRAWSALREALATGVTPDRELADAAVILGGGMLIAIPGFVTDVAGLLAVAPFTRPAVRGLATRWVSRRAALGGLRMTPPWPRRSAEGGEDEPPAGGGPVIQGEVLDEHTERQATQQEADRRPSQRDGRRDTRPRRLPNSGRRLAVQPLRVPQALFSRCEDRAPGCGSGPRLDRIAASRSARTASRSSMDRRSSSMSQCVRAGLAFFGAGSSPVTVIALAPHTRHSHVGGISASAANGTVK
jgi:UPF0716 protein FxsA